MWPAYTVATLLTHPRGWIVNYKLKLGPDWKPGSPTSSSWTAPTKVCVPRALFKIPNFTSVSIKSMSQAQHARWGPGLLLCLAGSQFWVLLSSWLSSLTTGTVSIFFLWCREQTAGLHWHVASVLPWVTSPALASCFLSLISVYSLVWPGTITSILNICYGFGGLRGGDRVNDQVSVCSPGWPGIHYVDQNRLECLGDYLLEPPCLA